MRLDTMFHKYGQKCSRCSRTEIDGTPTNLAFSTDHIHEKQDGGENKQSNYQLLCADCHSQKTILFRKRRQELKRALTAHESLELNDTFIHSGIQIRTRIDAFNFIRKSEAVIKSSITPADIAILPKYAKPKIRSSEK